MKDVTSRPMADDPEDARVERANTLLSSYPHLPPGELAELRQFLTRGPIIARGRVTGDEANAVALAAFRQAHPDLGKPTHRERVVVGTGLAIILALIGILLWDVGA